MDIVDIMQVFGYVGILIAGFILVFMQKGKSRICGHYTQPEWNFYLKRWYAQRIVRKIKENQHSLLKYEKNYDYESPKLLPSAKSSESQFIYGCDMNGNFLLLKFTRFQHRIAEIWLALRFEDGTVLTMPEHPDTRVCNGTPNKFEAHGLTLENLVPYSKWRIRFNGLLRRGIRTEFSEEIHESELEYVKFNFLWNACSVPQHWPYDWSPQLMATAIALEPWRDGNWKYMLNKADSGGYDQFGALKGRVFIQKEKLNWNKTFENSEKLDQNFVQIDLNLPGIRQRRWGPNKTSHLHRTASFIGVLQDGVVFECGAISSRTGLTHCQFGNFRTPSGKVFPIDWTDFHLSRFAENSEDLPESAIINLKANGRRFQLQVKFNSERCVPLMGGNPFNWIEYNVPFECTGYDGQKGCGMAMFWYPKRQEKFLHYRDFLRVKRVFYRHDIETHEPVIKLSKHEALNPKFTSEPGALLAVLDSVAHDRKPPKAITMQKSDNFLQSLNSPLDRLKKQSRTRTRFSESDKQEMNGQDGDNPFENLESDSDFHPKYLDCPLFGTCEGVVMYQKAFEMVLKENQELHDLLLTFGTTREVRSIECIVDVLKKVKTPKSLKEEVIKFLSTFKSEDYLYLTTLLNGKNSYCVSSTSSEAVLESIKEAWIAYFKTVDYEKLIRLPLDHFTPAISIQMIKNSDQSDPDNLMGTFSCLKLNDDPRNFLIEYGHDLEASTLIRNSSDLPLNKLIVTRNYNYTSYNVAHETKVNNSVLTEEIAIRIARLGSTLEKMLAVELKLYWQIIDNKIFIIHAKNITDNSLTDWELQNEFDSAEMSFELKDSSKDFTPLTISSVVSRMSQSQQKVFNEVSTKGLYRYGKIVRKLSMNGNTAVTIRRFLGINGEEAFKHLYLNAKNYRFEFGPAKEFLDKAEKVCKKEKLNQIKDEKEILKEISGILKNSQVFFDYYYNLIALQRSWLYVIFKFICGTCSGMKAEHYEDFALVAQYFNIRDLSAQKFVQSCKSIGDDFFGVSLSEMKTNEIIDMLHTIVDGNTSVHRPTTVELLTNENNSLSWSKHLHFAFESYLKIKGYNLNSTFNLRFPQEKKRIEHIMNHLVSASTKFDKFAMKLMLICLRNVTRKLQEANLMREKFLKLMQDAFRVLSTKCQSDDIYFMTMTELQLFIEKKRFDLLMRAHDRHLSYKNRKTPEKEVPSTELKEVYGNCVCPGTAVGFALVTNEPSQKLITENIDPMILVTNNLRKNVGWLPYLRLFKGIVLEADGYFDADAAICRLVGVPCIIGAKDAMKMFKTGDNLLLNGTKGVVSRFTAEE